MQVKKILIIDDETELTEILQAMLSSRYSDVQSFTCPEQAIKKITSCQFDLIITDLNMPKLLGLQLAKLVRSMGIKIPIILLTGYTDKHLLQTAFQLGIFQIMEKPFALKDLLKAVEKAFSNSKMEQNSYLNYHEDSFQHY